MKLFKIVIRHCAPRDKKENIVGWFLAPDDETVMHYIDRELLSGIWSDRQEDSLNSPLTIYDEYGHKIGTEHYFERMLRVKGEYFDENASYDDAYYGVTHYGWEAGIDVAPEQEAILLTLGVAKKI